MGFNYNDTIFQIKNKIFTKKYSQIFIIGANSDADQQEYQKTLIAQTPKDILIVSLAPCRSDSENVVSVNGCFDSYALLKLSEDINTITNLKKTIFVQYCGRHTVSSMIHLSLFNNTNVYLGKCSPMIINPTLISFISKNFGIKEMTTVKKDLECILNDIN